MKYQSIFIVSLLLTCVIIPTQASSLPEEQDSEPHVFMSAEYSDFGNIKIINNSDFIKQAEVNGWDHGGERDGSKLAPYIISGYNITTLESRMVVIRNTDLYFEFSNNYLNGQNNSSAGLQIQNVTNAVVKDNIFTNFTGVGIIFFTSHNSTVQNNSVTHAKDGGLHLWLSTNLSVEENSIHDNGIDGMYIFNVNDSLIVQNEVYNHPQYGIHYLESFHSTVGYNTLYGQETGINVNSGSYNTFTGNNLSDNTNHGLELSFNSSYNLIIDNNVTRSGGSGIMLRPSSLFQQIGNQLINNSFSDQGSSDLYLTRSNQTKIEGNQFGNSDYGGLYLITSHHATIRYNTFKNILYDGLTLTSATSNNSVLRNQFIDNIHSEGSHASDSGTNNNFEYNYWSDWTSPDKNGDGIVDEPYVIDRDTNQQDPYPIVSLDNMDAIYEPFTNTSDPSSELDTFPENVSLSINSLTFVISLLGPIILGAHRKRSTSLDGT